MKLLTTNFVQCTVRSCARSTEAFPLKYENCELVHTELEYDPQFIANVLPKIDWPALRAVAADLGNTSLPEEKPALTAGTDKPEAADDVLAHELHSLLLETQIQNGTMTCRNCGHLYHIKNTIPNFLLPPHLA